MTKGTDRRPLSLNGVNGKASELAKEYLTSMVWLLANNGKGHGNVESTDPVFLRNITRRSGLSVITVESRQNVEYVTGEQPNKYLIVTGVPKRKEMPLSEDMDSPLEVTLNFEDAHVMVLSPTNMSSKPANYKSEDPGMRLMQHVIDSCTFRGVSMPTTSGQGTYNLSIGPNTKDVFLYKLDDLAVRNVNRTLESV